MTRLELKETVDTLKRKIQEKKDEDLMVVVEEVVEEYMETLKILADR